MASTPEIERAQVQFRAASDATRKQAREHLLATIRDEAERHAGERHGRRAGGVKRLVDGVEGAPDSAITLKK